MQTKSKHLFAGMAGFRNPDDKIKKIYNETTKIEENDKNKILKLFSTNTKIDKDGISGYLFENDTEN